MKHLLLFEKFLAPFDGDQNKVIQRMEAFGFNKNSANMAINALQGWFYGTYMSVGDNKQVDLTIDIMRRLKRGYHTQFNGKVYRVAHLRVHPGSDEDSILSIKKTQTGPKVLQSWSSTKQGAMWFFKHFVKEQNHSDSPEENKAWVLLSTDAKNLEQLLSFEECMQFLYDLGLAFPSVEDLADSLVLDEMLKLHELICVTPHDLDVKIENVLVLPK